MLTYLFLPFVTRILLALSLSRSRFFFYHLFIRSVLLLFPCAQANRKSYVIEVMIKKEKNRPTKKTRQIGGKIQPQQLINVDNLINLVVNVTYAAVFACFLLGFVVVSLSQSLCEKKM